MRSFLSRIGLMADIPDEELQNFIRNFLKEFKALVIEHGLIVQERLKNQQGLLALGLTFRQREAIVLSLSLEDYSAGPVEDEYKPGHYWIFGKRIEDVEVYIKVKIAGPPEKEHAVCFSFHKAEYPLSYPFAR
jgi:hypothetical protein